MIAKRNRARQMRPLSQRLREFADNARQAADRVPHGEEKNHYLKRAEEAERGLRMESWLSSPELKWPD